MTLNTTLSSVFDPVDRSIIDALHRDGRAPWSRIAESVGVSAATVRRRYDNMHSRGLIRVIGATDVARLGLGTPVYLRFTNALSDLNVLIQRLQARTEVRFLTTLLGSVDVVAELVLPRSVDYPRMVSELTAGTNAHAESALITHAFVSGQAWMPPPDSGELPDVLPMRGEPAPPVHLSQAEAKILGMLMHEGRASLAELAEAIERSENTAARTIEHLKDNGLLDFRVLVEPRNLGLTTEAMVWMEIEPPLLKRAADSLARQRSTKFLGSTTGRFNLTAQIVLSDRSELFEYSTEVLGAVPGMRSVELSVQLQTHKRVWTSISNEEAYMSEGEPLDLLGFLQPSD